MNFTTGISAKQWAFLRSFEKTNTDNIIICDPKEEYASLNALLTVSKVPEDGTTVVPHPNSGRTAGEE